RPAEADEADSLNSPLILQFRGKFCSNAMLHTAKELHDFTVGATDGEIGEVKDIYFDDERWAVRYLVVQTGGWLSGRKVLISPISVRDIDWDGEVLNVNLSQQQVRESPSIDTDKP